ncbi:aminotransferase class V-fold PLP-dependent enzyme, partial [Streptococcus infantarius]|uniref:aminotransferase class V-fold PLP-dependent enzyme n=1 Tax=Streptococcus infantarius TaxID=102684 RepID=UPI00336AA066
NWVAQFAQELLKKDDELLISVLEHHANVVPWQQVCHKTGEKLVYVYLKDAQLDMEDLRRKPSNKTKYVSLDHVSNVLVSV